MNKMDDFGRRDNKKGQHVKMYVIGASEELLKAWLQAYCIF